MKEQADVLIILFRPVFGRWLGIEHGMVLYDAAAHAAIAADRRLSGSETLHLLPDSAAGHFLFQN